MLCDGNLIANTGICPGNYKWWASKDDCDQWFINKSVYAFSNYEFVRADEASRYGSNVMCVHLAIPREQIDVCDYVSFRNGDNGRWYHCVVVGREYRNANSSVIYFSVDYVATYWDTIVINKSFIERTHVNDDWAGDQFANNYLLNEPFQVQLVPRADLYNGSTGIGALVKSTMDALNTNLPGGGGSSQYCLMADAAPEDGDISKPRIRFQNGASVSGYPQAFGSKGDMEQVLAKYVTYSRQFITISSPYMQNSTFHFLIPWNIPWNIIVLLHEKAGLC